MVRVAFDLLDGGKFGKPEILTDGASFAELFAAWHRQCGKVDQLHEQCEAEGWPPEKSEHLDLEVQINNKLESVMWAFEIMTLEELKMLAELDATYDESEHVHPGALGRAVLRIVGRPSEPVAQSPSLFSPPTVPRIGLSTGR
jgi:hypothetical protein